MKKILFTGIVSAVLLSSCSFGYFEIKFPPVREDNSMNLSNYSIYIQNRITKKPFGLKISPVSSPVTPERFSGYHTGTDFEVFENEEDMDFIVTAICTGPLVLKNYTSGYGGVAIQKCTINSEDVTVLYGHLQLSSITAEINQTIVQSEAIGLLGKGYSEETDGERKHLHLSIHKGGEVELKGYVQNADELDEWIDPETVL